MAWTEGDLKIFAAGLSIGGKWNLGTVTEAGSVKAYNDYGEYKFFYLVFTNALADFTYGQSVSSISVKGFNSMLPITKIEKVNNYMLKIWCDISKEDHGITVLGSPNSWLRYEASGKRVSAFSTFFLVAGLKSYIDYAWVNDACQMPVLCVSKEMGVINYFVCNSFGITDSAQAVIDVTASENVDISYT